MGEFRTVSFGVAGPNVVPFDVTAVVTAGAARIVAAGLPEALAETVTGTVRAAMTAMGLSRPLARVAFRFSGDVLAGTCPALAFPASLALLWAMGVIPASVREFAAVAGLQPDGSIVPVEGAARAAAHAARRGLGLICATGQDMDRAACPDLLAAPDLLTLINALRGIARQPLAQDVRTLAGAVGPGMSEPMAAAFALHAAPPPAPPGEWDGRLGRFWARLFGSPPDTAAPRANGPAARPAGMAEASNGAAAALDQPEAQATAALPFATTGPLGHRGRMRERVLDRGTDSLADYELLEMLLFLAFKTGDTKPLAKRLINRFGSFANVLAAPQRQLLDAPGLGPHAVVALQLVRAAATRMARAEVKDQPILGSSERLIAYLTMVLAREQVEQFRVLFLDTRNRLLADEAQSRGTVNHTPVYPREVVKRALELHATAMILVHNHPSGDPTPSRDDIEMTREIKQAGQLLGIALHEHIIIGNGRWVSFKSEGLL